MIIKCKPDPNYNPLTASIKIITLFNFSKNYSGMNAYSLALIILLAATDVFAHTDNFDVFTYQPPEFFTKIE